MRFFQFLLLSMCTAIGAVAASDARATTVLIDSTVTGCFNGSGACGGGPANLPPGCASQSYQSGNADAGPRYLFNYRRRAHRDTIQRGISAADGSGALALRRTTMTAPAMCFTSVTWRCVW